MKHSLKCRLCMKKSKGRGNQDKNCKKSLYACESCNEYSGKSIHLCVTCFKKFHLNIKFYMIDQTRTLKKLKATTKLRKKPISKRLNSLGQKKRKMSTKHIKNNVEVIQIPTP